jgi:hypothetical protein
MAQAICTGGAAARHVRATPIIAGSYGHGAIGKLRNLKKAASQSLLPRTAIRRHSYPGLSFASVVRRVSNHAPLCNAPDLHCLIDDPLVRKQFTRFHTGHSKADRAI